MDRERFFRRPRRSCWPIRRLAAMVLRLCALAMLRRYRADGGGCRLSSLVRRTAKPLWSPVVTAVS